MNWMIAHQARSLFHRWFPPRRRQPIHRRPWAELLEDRVTPSVTFDWARQFGTASDDTSYSVAADGNGNVYVSGYTSGTFAGQSSAGGRDCFLAKYDISGTRQWLRQFGTVSDDTLRGVAVDGSGNVYVSGDTKGTFSGQSSAGGQDAFLAKYDSNGTQQWLRQFGTTSADGSTGITIDVDGSAYVIGYSVGYLPFLAKYDSGGTQKWVRDLYGDNFTGVAVDGSGNVYVSGDIAEAFPGQTYVGDSDGILVKYDSSGTLQWGRQFGTLFVERYTRVAADANGNVYVVGSTEGKFPNQPGGYGNSDCFLVSYGSNGLQKWLRQFGSTTTNDDYVGVVVDGNGKIYVTSTTWDSYGGQTYAGLTDIILVRYDSNGTQQWAREFGTNAYELWCSVASDGKGGVYISGSTTGTFAGQSSVGGYDAFLVKYTDNDPPTITLSGSSDNVLTSTNPAFSWSISDADGNLASATVTVTRDGMPVYTRDYTAPVSNESLSLNPLGLGSYQITITATDALGAVSSATRTANVLNSPPTATFSVTTPEANRLEGSVVSFDGSASSDFDGPLTGYVWNFGDGTLATGPTASHTYADNGTFAVKLTVVDAVGEISTTTQTVGIANVRPTLHATSPATAAEMVPVTLTIGVTDPGTDRAGYTVNWGDGTADPYATGGDKQHIYSTGGQQYTIRVHIADEDGVYFNQYVAPIDVLNAPPVILNFPASLTAEANVSRDVAVTVVDGADDTYTFSWDFGDGAIASGADLATVSHAYVNDGVYTLSLTVSDSDGLATTLSAPVVIGAPVSFTVAEQVAPEGGGPVTVTARLDNGVPLATDVTIPLVFGGTAGAGDYTAPAPQIVIPAGQLTGSVTVSILNDSLDEDDEVLVIGMGLPVGASRGAVAEHRITITDDDAPPAAFLSTPPQTLDETNRDVTVTAALSAVSGRDVILPLSFAGTATAGQDYTIPDPAQIVIPAGNLSGTYTFSLLDDVTVEPAETIVVSALPSAQAQVVAAPDRPTVVTFVVAANDAPIVSLDSAYRLTAEGVPAIQVRARLDHFTDSTITVPFTVSGTDGRGSAPATSGVDYVITTSSLVFLPGTAEAEVTVSITDDDLVEGTENFLIELEPPTNAILGVSQTVLTDILDNEIVRVSFAPGEVTEWEGEVVPVTVHLSNASTQPTTVQLVVTGTAQEGSDFTLSTHELVIPAEVTEQTLYCTLTDDALNEGLAYFSLTLGTITGGVAGEVNTKRITIQDNDPIVSLPPFGLSASEGDGTVTFTVSLSAPTNRAVTVPVSYSGTARRGDDYTGPDLVTIPAGSVSAGIVLAINDDPLVEPTESVNLAIGTPTTGVLGRSTTSLEIRDNDRAEVSWSSSVFVAQEEQGVVGLSVVLSQPALTDVDVNFRYAPVEAQPGDDYVIQTSRVTIPQGEKTGTLLVSLGDDGYKEATESFTVTMSSAWGADLPADSVSHTARVDITDGDQYTAAEVKAAVVANLALSGSPPPKGSEVGDALSQALRDQGMTEPSPEVNAFLQNALLHHLTSLATDLGAEYGGILGGITGFIGFNTITWFRERYPLEQTWGSTWIDWDAVQSHYNSNPEGFKNELKYHLAREAGKLAAAAIIEGVIPIPGAGAVVVAAAEAIYDNREAIGEAIEAGANHLAEQGKAAWNNIQETITVQTSIKVSVPSTPKLGPGDGTTVFFDTDFNGIRSENEPYGITTADGNALVFGVQTADLNQDSILGINEGQWVATGGTDTSVNLPFRVPLVAPPTFRIMSGASTLVSKLVQIGAYPRTSEGLLAAEQRFSVAFGLPQDSWSGWDFVEEAAAGNTAAAALFGKETQFYNTVVMAASFFEGRSAGLSFTFLADVAIEDIAHKISDPDSSLDLTREAVAASIIRGISFRTGIAVEDSEVALLASAMAQANQLIDHVPVEASSSYLASVVRVQRAVQSDFADTLAGFGRGDVTVVGLQAAVTGLPAAAAAAPVFNIQPVYLTGYSDPVVEGDDGESYLEFTVFPLSASALPVTVNYRTDNGTAHAGEDYIAETGTLTWAAGDDTPRTVRIRVTGDTTAESDETVSLILTDAVNATIFTGTLQGRIINDDPVAFVSADDQDETFTVLVSNSKVTIDRSGTNVFSGTFPDGLEVTLTGQAGDTLALADRADSVLQSIGQDGARTIEVSGHTIHASGFGTLSDELAFGIVGIPANFYEGQAVTLVVTAPPASLNPESLTYRWTVTGPDGGTPVELGALPTIEYLPHQEDGWIDVSVTDGIRTFTVRSQVIVRPPNVAPVASDDSFTTDEDTGYTGNVTASDEDGDSLTYVLETSPAHGTVILGNDGSFTYTPDENYHGADSFTYKANDGELDSNIGTETITILPVNDPPVATDGIITTDEDIPVIGTLVATDVEEDALTYSVVNGPLHGTVQLAANRFTYTPEANYNGPDCLTFKVNDGELDSNTATVNISIAAVNDAPVAQDASLSTNEDTPLTGSLGAYASDVEGSSLTFAVVGEASHGTLTLNPDGSYHYTPALNYNGSDTFTYQANDGLTDSNKATVTITVTPVNDAPVLVDQSFNVEENRPDGTLVGIVSALDVDGDPMIFAIESGNRLGAFRIDPATGTLKVANPGALDFEVLSAYTLKVSVSDGIAAPQLATVAIQLVDVAEAPANLSPDPLYPVDPTKTMLVVHGTSQDDTILLTPSGHTGEIEVVLNGSSQGIFTPTSRLVIYGHDGNDDLQVAGGISLPAWLYGGLGNDRLKGGAGENVLVGGGGDDLLVGGNGRDFLVGGEGADRLVGSAEDDLLIAGSLNFADEVAAINAIMAEWTSTRFYTDRTAAIVRGAVGTDGKLYQLTTEGPEATVVDDGVADTLTGSAGQDWFFANLALEEGDDSLCKDKITDLKGTEFAADLDWINTP